MTLVEKTPDKLLRDDVIRQTLEAAAKAIEMRSGNPTYERAWDIAAKIVRDLVPVLTRNA